MNNLDIIKKHLIPDVKVDLNEDGSEFIMLKPLNVAQQALAVELGPKFEGLEKDSEGNVQINAELLTEVNNLLCSVIERSVEGISKDDVENFVSGHLELLMVSLEKLIPQETDKKDLIKQRLEAMKDGQTNKS